MSDQPAPHIDDIYPLNIYRGTQDSVEVAFVNRLDTILAVALVASIAIACLAAVVEALRIAGIVAVLILLGGMLTTILFKRRLLPDRLSMRQSDHMIAIAIKTTALLRHGLTEETAMEACSIILDEVPSIEAIALTDAKRVLGYAGFGCIHHQQWRSIKSAYSKACLRDKTTQVVSNIECIDSCCPLKSAIIVPLILHDEAVGSIKFYYSDASDLTRDQRAMAESIAGLVSVQLEVYELEKEAAFVREMELKMLQAQIDPHFLFNTLNTIASLTRTDPQTARDLIANFAQFYRYTLEEGTEEETFRDSIDMVLHYYDLEQARFGDRLRLYVDIDEDILDLRVPRFLMQPLVENSIKHGMHPSGRRLTIWIQAQVVPVTDGEEPSVLISVKDNGVGIPAKRIESIVWEGESEKGLGLALRNIRGQIRHYYGRHAHMEVTSEEGVGTEVTYRIPLVEQRNDEAPPYPTGEHDEHTT